MASVLSLLTSSIAVHGSWKRVDDGLEGDGYSLGLALCVERSNIRLLPAQYNGRVARPSFTIRLTPISPTARRFGRMWRRVL